MCMECTKENMADLPRGERRRVALEVVICVLDCVDSALSSLPSGPSASYLGVVSFVVVPCRWFTRT